MIEPLLQAERLLLHGMVDQAEALYRRTLEADPLSSIAVVGLARVALERGDDRGAYEQAVAALAIDPRNAAALGLESRLAEVLATRGDPVQRPAWLAGQGRASDAAPPTPRPVAPGAPLVDTDTGTGMRAAAESAAFARNPSMQDHRRRMEQSSVDASASPPQPDSSAQPRRRKGLLRRMLGG